MSEDMGQKPPEEEPENRELEEEHDREMREVISLGHEARLFLDGPLAEYILISATSRVENAYLELGKVNPSDKDKIVELQTEIAKFNLYNRSLEELVAAGDSAYQAFREQSAT